MHMQSKKLVGLLRRLIREEVQLEVRKVINEMNFPAKRDDSSWLVEGLSSAIKSPKKVEKSYTGDPILDSIINQTSEDMRQNPEDAGVSLDHFGMDMQMDRLEDNIHIPVSRTSLTETLKMEPRAQPVSRKTTSSNLLNKPYGAFMKAYLEKKNA